MSAREIIWPVLLKFWKETDGQDMVEYSLLLAFIALAGVVILSNARSSISSIWNKANSSLSTAAS